MSGQTIKYTRATIPVITTDEIVFRETVATYNWTPSNKTGDRFTIINQNIVKSGIDNLNSYGILSNVSFYIGCDKTQYILESIGSGVVSIGLAHINQPLKNKEAPVSKTINILEGDIIRCSISETTFSIEKINNSSYENYYIDLMGFMGTTMFIWVSSVPKYSMCLKLYHDITASITLSHNKLNIGSLGKTKEVNINADNLFLTRSSDSTSVDIYKQLRDVKAISETYDRLSADLYMVESTLYISLF
jgi:hypothetical protein